MDQAEWLEMDSELVLAYARRLKTEFKEEPSIATMINGAMIRAEHLGLFGKPAITKPTGSGPASNTDGWGDKNLICPECLGSVAPEVSRNSGKVFYRCRTCSDKDSAMFINRDGTAKRVTNKG